MKRKMAALLVAMVLLFSMMPMTQAASASYPMAKWGMAAEALWEDGLFLGTGTSFDLDKPMNRAAGITMVVRLLGKEAEAKEAVWETPFDDVPAWAVPYVGYAYTNNITKGTAADKFGSDTSMTATQFLTFVLRTLGYNDAAGDFSWDKAESLAVEIGLITKDDLSGGFTRGQAALISYHALSMRLKGSDRLLKETITFPGQPEGSMPTWTSNPAAFDDITKIYAEANARRREILNSDTGIVKSTQYVQGETYTGTAYYVSNDGNDSNSGKSPETAWASLERLNRAQLKEGDAVFFRRGDTWYAGEKYWDNVLWYGCIRIRSGVTYSAYGEGEKPAFIGSMPGLADPSRWVSEGTTADGGKLWRYVDKLHSVSGVLMNDGNLWSEMQLPGWNGKTYVNANGSAFTVEDSLTKDLMSFHALELTGRPANTVVEDEGLTGYLYLRCDKGNPGNVFYDIQFVAGGIGVGTEGEFGSNATVDNLSIQYFSQIGVSLGGYQGWENTLVQNCEIAYCGGMTQAYVESGRFGYGKATYSGGAIQMSGSGNRAINNYIHGVDSKAFVVVIHDRGEDISTSYENLVMRGNLIENSGTALQVMSCLRDENSKRTGIFKDLVFEDNYVMHTGDGWFNCRLAALEEIYKEYGQLSALNFMGVKDGVIDNVQITNNVLCCADYALVAIKTTLNNYPTFSGNTYIQYADERMATIHHTDILANSSAAAAITKNFGDTQAKVLITR